MTLFGLLFMWACLNCVSGCRWITYRKPNHAPLTHAVHAVTHKATTAAKRNMVFRESTFGSFFHSFSSVMWPPGSSCWLPHCHAHAHRHTRSLSSSLSLSFSCATSPPQLRPFWWCHLLNHYQIALWLGQSRPSKEAGLSHGIGCYFLLVNLHLKSPQRIHNTYIHNRWP